MNDSTILINMGKTQPADSKDLPAIENQPHPDNLNWLHFLIKKAVHFLIDLRFPSLLMSHSGDTSEANKTERYHKTKIHQNPNHVEDRLHYVRIFLSVMVSYFALKSIIVSTAHVLDMTSLDRRRLKSNPDLVPFTTGKSFVANMTRAIMPQYYQKTIEQVATLSDSESNSVRSLSSSRAIVQFVVGLTLFYVYVLVTPLIKRKSVDATNLRFMLDPTREIKRVDLMIRNVLNKISDESPGNRLVTDLATQISSLRPFTFTTKWYHTFYWVTSALLIPMSITTLVFTGVFYYIFVLTAKESLCTFKQVDKCNYGDAFSGIDTFYVSEIVFADWLLTTNGSFVLFIYGLNSVCQLVMIHNAERELRICRSTLINAVKYFEEFQHSHLYQNRLYQRATIFSGLKGAGSISYGGSSSGWSGRQQDVELRLLRTYVNLTITGHEVKKTVLVIGAFVEIYLTVSSAAILIIFLISMVNGSSSDMIEEVLLATYWLLTNPILFASAYVSTRTIKLEKIAWSVLAELAKYRTSFVHRGNMRLYRSNDRLFTVLERRWRRLVESYALSDRRNSIRAFGLSLTYGQVLSLNFFLMSTASILRIF